MDAMGSVRRWAGARSEGRGALGAARGAVARRGRRISAGPATGLRIGSAEASADYALGTNELPVQVALADALGAGDVFLDVGANVGFFSLLAARLVGPTGAVWAVEPVPANVAQIQHNARRNRFRNLAVVDAAASSSAGTTTLLLAVHPGGAVIASAGAPPDPAGALEVRTVRIDDLVASGQVRPPTVVKIDVEGAELDVLEGMPATLRDHRPVVVCEVDGRDDAAVASQRSAVVALLVHAGYDVEVLPRSYDASDWRVDHLVARPRPGGGS